MKHFINPLLAAAFIAVVVDTGLGADNATAGMVDFGKFTPPSSGEFVEVNVKSNLIGMVARLAEKHEPEIAELIRGLKLIRVNVIGLNGENTTEVEKRVRAIREELDAQQWERLVTVQKEGDDVGIFLKTRGEEAIEGLVITVLHGKKEAVLVNIVGNIRPDKVATIGERFHIEHLRQVGQKLEQK
jgi:hypothetical protein